ncbi:MAG: acylneuraminate cytidylyltransferase family protein [Desulfobacteraceae bacterium]|nr:MAG: acylneuraminate cytidylyltransferase family protein [Desulfobacteraceae bacterium]
MNEILGLITARGGSKSLPRKNILPLAGKPLIAWTIESARKSRSLDRIIISTDDPEIASTAQEWGAEVPFLRPASLAQDATPHILVVNHVLEWMKQEDLFYKYIMLLQPTSPFRTEEDIEAAADIAFIHKASAVLSVCEMNPHPYQSKIISTDGIIQEFVPSDSRYHRRQDFPPAFAPNGAIYLNKVESLLKDQVFVPPNTYAYIMPPERSVDIDTPWDFYLAGLVMQDRIRNAQV